MTRAAQPPHRRGGVLGAAQGDLEGVPSGSPIRQAANRRRPRSVGGGGGGGLPLHGGRGGPGEFGAPDEEERDGDGGQADEPADPECPVESAGERVRDGVALAEQDMGVRGRYG